MELYFDGASKGNPGKASSGFVIYKKTLEGKVILFEKSILHPTIMTNNQAEYLGMIEGMKHLIEIYETNIELYIRGDSQLVLYHMTGKYKCKSPNLINLYKEAKDLERKFNKIIYQWVPRKNNAHADQLCNQAFIK